MGANVVVTPSDCSFLDGHFIEKISRCIGGGSPGFQNTQAFSYTARGIPKKEICKKMPSFVNEVKINDGNVIKSNPDLCTEKDLNSWQKLESCGMEGAFKSWNCYQCVRELSNGNNTYYMVIAFSSDCSEGIVSDFSESRKEDWRAELEDVY